MDATTRQEAAEPPDDPEIYLAEPNVGARELELVGKVLETGKIAHGPAVTRLEQEMRRVLGREHAVGLASGTAALHLALLVAGVRPGDEVLMPALTFVAPANAITYARAVPVLLDIEPDYRQLDIERLERWLRRSCRMVGRHAVRSATGRRVAAVIAVDSLGHPTDMRALREVVEPYGIKLIDDAAEALGAEANGQPVGTGADIVCVSLNANKTVTAGGGGMLLCDDPDTAKRVRYLAGQAKDRGIGWVHSEVGFNYRLPSVPAAIASAQLERLGEFVDHKRALARAYEAELEDLPGLTFPSEAPWAKSTYWLYTVHVDESAFGTSRAALVDAFKEHRIEARLGFSALHRHGAYEGFQGEDCPVAELLGATGLCLPSSTTLGDDDLAKVVAVVRTAARV